MVIMQYSVYLSKIIRSVKRYLLLILFILTMLPSRAQDDYEWWNKKHNWDGVSPWSSYLTYSPAYFGPNALPVPEIRNGLIKKRINLETRSDMHLSPGDNTFNLFLKLDKGRYESPL